MPLVATEESWVAIASLPSLPPGKPEWLADDGVNTVLVGISADLGEWTNEAVDLYTGSGGVCRGELDRGAIGVIDGWNGKFPVDCGPGSSCRASLAAKIYASGKAAFVLAHVAVSGRCEAPLWARRTVAGLERPMPAVAVDDEHLANLAIAQFRRRSGWQSLQDRWLSSTPSLDSTEWDTAGGAAPEVALFHTGNGDLLTVAGLSGDECSDRDSFSYSAIFRVAYGANRVLSPTSSGTQAAPGFAPILLAPGKPDLFASVGLVTLPDGALLDVRRRTCPRPKVMEHKPVERTSSPPKVPTTRD